MKSQMSSFDIAAAVRELQQCVGHKAEKFFLVNHRELLLRLVSIHGKRTAVMKLGRGLWLEDGFRTVGDSEPPTFAMLLRKYLSGKSIKAISQHGFDRVVVFTFDSQPELRLVAELFGSGNIILIEGQRIIQPLTSKSWRARDVKSGKDYAFPPESCDPLSLDREALAGIILSSGKDLVRCLATEVNLGGAYAEEICFGLGIGKNTKASDLNPEDLDDVYEFITVFRQGLECPEPHILLDPDGNPIDVLPFSLSIHEDVGKKDYDRFCLAARDYFGPMEDFDTGQVKNPRLAQLERQMESQMEALANLESLAAESQAAGDMLYANYGFLDAALREMSAKLEGGNWQALKKDIEDMPNVKIFDPAAGNVTVSLPDGTDMTLDIRMNLNENAAAFYERAKKARHKAEGARSAIADTGALQRSILESEVSAAVQTEKRPTKRFWFDKFRWFVSSEGFMVVGGRDTRTNDQVVKKHLKDGDLYAHADMNGAPSVVIKDGAEAQDATLEEACIFAVAFSRAWKNKLASGSAYWVKPDQVSKTPQPGEFVPKGAFIIRGKRNYSRRVEMRLAVARVSINGSEKIMCGPVSAVRAHAGEMFVIEPGQDKRSDFAKRLSDHFNVPIEDVDRVLPSGDIRIVEG